ncbi:copper amine oxidase N-terminal domain-containing protein [Rubeoparvulum massiliense]|uniref:copper amine oxidase N-terminal domain-containing protein n=1 Tax=Rubeoparvulum massiliense TaxID=1631346 RepID=UPI00065E7341|nr:copper amine oxidase N-terminal domain-containing protein [Rubeoparvulum massiliense]
MKRKVVVLLVLLLSITALSVYAAVPLFFEKHKDLESVRVTLNGNLITGDVPPFIIEGRTVIPLREVSQELGLLVQWNQKKDQVQIYKPSVNMVVINEALNRDNNKTIVEPQRTFKQGAEYQLVIYAEVDHVPTSQSFDSKIVLVSPKGEEVHSFFKNDSNYFSTNKNSSFKVRNLVAKGTFTELGDYKLLFKMKDFDSSNYVTLAEKVLTVE